MGLLSTRACVALLCLGFISACGSPEDGLFTDEEDAAQWTASQTRAEALHLIINGVPSDAKSFQSAGALLIRGIDTYGLPIDSICTGTLIAPDVVLTAGHCKLDESEAKAPRYYFTFALDITEAGDTISQMPPNTVTVKGIVRHPRFSIPDSDGLGHAYDLALVFLRRPFTKREPMAILRPDEASALRVGARADIVGYGLRTAPEDDPYANDAGIKAEAVSVINEIGRYEMQVGRIAPTPQKCFGDSGGPTYLTLANGEKRLVGVTSRAYDDKGCKKGGVDSRTDVYYNWIGSVMQKACQNGTRATCYPLP